MFQSVKILGWLALGLCALALGGCVTSEPGGLAPGQLSAPEREMDRQYLGLAQAAGPITISDIQAEWLIIEVFDMYCHRCHLAAEEINQIYNRIQEKGCQNEVKMIGLGVGDTLMEANTFKTKFKVPFPALPDRSGKVASQFGAARPPGIIVLKKEAGKFKVVLNQNWDEGRAAFKGVLKACSPLS